MEPKQTDLFRVCFGLFRETKNKNFRFVLVFRNNQNQQICFVANRNKPKKNRATLNFLKKYPNILSFKLFGWVFCLFRFN
jgi:hypothetical protein